MIVGVHCTGDSKTITQWVESLCRGTMSGVWWVFPSTSRFPRKEPEKPRVAPPSPGPDAGHTFLTVDTGNSCETSASPFVSDCDYDQTGAILKWIYGELKPSGDAEHGKYVVFNQSPFASGLAAKALSMFLKHALNKAAAACTSPSTVASKIAIRLA